MIIKILYSERYKINNHSAQNLQTVKKRTCHNFLNDKVQINSSTNNMDPSISSKTHRKPGRKMIHLKKIHFAFRSTYRFYSGVSFKRNFLCSYADEVMLLCACLLRTRKKSNMVLINLTNPFYFSFFLNIKCFTLLCKLFQLHAYFSFIAIIFSSVVVLCLLSIISFIFIFLLKDCSQTFNHRD